MELVFLDTETTGNEIGKDRLCQLCYRTEDGVTTAYFKPPVPVSVKAMSITHITNKMLEGKEAFCGSEAAKRLQEKLDRGVLVAHNAKFDIAMLEAEGLSVPRFICTLRVARALDPKNAIPEYNLQFLRYYLDLDVDGTPHDAESDVNVMYALFERLLAKVMEGGLDREAAIARMIEMSSTPTVFTQFSFGKYAGRSIEEIAKSDRGYLEWLLRQKSENPQNEEDWIYTLKHHLGQGGPVSSEVAASAA